MWNVFEVSVLLHVVKLILKGLFVVVDVEHGWGDVLAIVVQLILKGVVCDNVRVDMNWM